MRIFDHEVPDGTCERIGASLGHIGSKWGLPVVMRLSDGPQRYNALRRTFPGLSQKVLTSTLRGLERNGYVRRTVISAAPPATVEYALTDQCTALLLPVRDLIRVAVDQLPEIELARVRFDAGIALPP